MQNPERTNRPLERAFAARDKAVAFAMKRKEEYLGARVPKELKASVLQTADKLGIPVSLLIRKVLEEVFTRQTGADSVIESIKANTADSATQAVIDDERFANIIGWKTIEMNKKRSCERCAKPLGVGATAFIGMADGGNPDLIICTSCKDQLQAQ